MVLLVGPLFGCSSNELTTSSDGVVEAPAERATAHDRVNEARAHESLSGLMSVTNSGRSWQAHMGFSIVDPRLFDGVGSRCTNRKVIRDEVECNIQTCFASPGAFPSTCDFAPEPNLPADWQEPRDVSVGTATIRGGTTLISVHPSGTDNVVYEPVGGPSNLWMGGETLVFGFTGTTTIASFTGELTAPTRDVTVSPSSNTLDRGKPYRIEWQLGTTAKGKEHGTTRMAAFLGMHDRVCKKKPVLVSCTFPLAAEAGDVPGEVTSALGTGSGFVITQTQSRAQGVGPERITLEAVGELVPDTQVDLTVR